MTSMRRLLGFLLVLAVLTPALTLASGTVPPDGANVSKIAIIDKAPGVVPAAKVQADLTAFQDYEKLVCRAWHCNASVYFASSGKPNSSRDWTMTIAGVDTQGCQCYGYHWIAAGGRPVGKVFAGTAAQDGVDWTTVLTHEESEMLGDPFAQLASQGACVDETHQTQCTFYAYELADPVQQVNFLVDNVAVSDFVWRTWFQLGVKAVQYDQVNATVAPLALAPAGGYMGVYQNDAWGSVSNMGFKRANVLNADPSPAWLAKHFPPA